MGLQRQITFLLVLLTVRAKTTAAFLLTDSQCVAPLPCTCSGSHDIRCDYKALTDIPKFSPVTSNDFTWSFRIRLNSNKLTFISANAFRNLGSVNTTSMSLYINDNKISSIDTDAFAGVGNKTTYLDLKNNNLTSLPSALQNLPRLRTLYLEGNPLASLETSVLLHLSPHLEFFGFDMAKFNVWPADLSRLQHLQTLVITHIPFTNLSLYAFVGLESRLTSLTLSNTKFARIPSAVCHLQNLHSLSFINNAGLESNNTLFEPCSHKLANLTSLKLNSNSLYAFPDVLHNFPSLTSLSLEDNHIRSVDTNVISYINITLLNMQLNQLTRIPFAFNKLKHLQSLWLYGNKITTIEDHDLIGLVKLGDLRIYGNPIEYIAPHAFSNNVQLHTLDFSSTKLQMVPAAVQYLPQLTSLDLSGNTIDCSCRMSYLKSWNVTAIAKFTGNCEKQHALTIKQYLLAQLPKCP